MNSTSYVGLEGRTRKLSYAAPTRPPTGPLTPYHYIGVSAGVRPFSLPF